MFLSAGWLIWLREGKGLGLRLLHCSSSYIYIYNYIYIYIFFFFHHETRTYYLVSVIQMPLIWIYMPYWCSFIWLFNWSNNRYGGCTRPLARPYTHTCTRTHAHTHTHTQVRVSGVALAASARPELLGSRTVVSRSHWYPTPTIHLCWVSHSRWHPNSVNHLCYHLRRVSHKTDILLKA